MNPSGEAAVVVIVVVILVMVSGFRIAQEYERGVVFRLGRFVGTRGPGLYYLLPFLETAKKIGEGVYGEVFRTRNKGQSVALKVRLL